jgi:hypothetical protein
MEFVVCLFVPIETEVNARLIRRLVAGFPARRSGFEPKLRDVGFVVDKAAFGAGLLLVFRFPLPLMSPAAPHSSSSIIRGWYSRPNSGRRATSSWPESPGVRSRYSHWLRATRQRGRSSIPSRAKHFHLSISSRPAPGLTQPPIQWVTGTLSRK